MDIYFLELLREWVVAEINYALAKREEGEDGYRSSAVSERKAADEAFSKLRADLLNR